jgi:hypothetical protein
MSRLQGLAQGIVHDLVFHRNFLPPVPRRDYPKPDRVEECIKACGRPVENKRKRSNMAMDDNAISPTTEPAPSPNSCRASSTGTARAPPARRSVIGVKYIRLVLLSTWCGQCGVKNPGTSTIAWKTNARDGIDLTSRGDHAGPGAGFLGARIGVYSTCCQPSNLMWNAALKASGGGEQATSGWVWDCEHFSHNSSESRS